MDHLLESGKGPAGARHHGGPDLWSATSEKQEDEGQERLAKLASFQLLMIRHAMKCASLIIVSAVTRLTRSTVPSAKRIAYSTCSVHAIENERVVRQALEAPEALEGRYKLAPREQVLPTWNRRGLNEEMGDPGALCGMSLATVADAHRTSIDHAQSLIRCSPDEDRTNGFFVCLFVRRDEADATDATTAKKRQIEGDSVEPSQSKRRKRRKKGASHTQTS